jgi:hypothetical protein
MRAHYANILAFVLVSVLIMTVSSGAQGKNGPQNGVPAECAEPMQEVSAQQDLVQALNCINIGLINLQQLIFEESLHLGAEGGDEVSRPGSGGFGECVLQCRKEFNECEARAQSFLDRLECGVENLRCGFGRCIF